MAGREVRQELTMHDSVSYLTSVKEALRDEPAKFKEFLKLLTDFKNHGMYKDSGIARMTELIKGHLRLLIGLCFFLPKAKTTIPAKPNKVIGQSPVTAIIFVPPELLQLNAPAYLDSVREAFRNEPANYKEWINILEDFKAHRVDGAGFIARAEGLMKNHRNLVRGLCAFSCYCLRIIPPEAVPPEAERHIVSDNKNRKRVKCYYPDSVNKPKVTMDDAVSYLIDVKEAFHDEPAKFNFFLKLFLLAWAKITIPPEVEQHIMSAWGKITIPPKAEQHITSARAKITTPPEAEQHIMSDNNKRKRAKCDDPDYDPDLDKPKKKKPKRKGKNASPPKKKVKVSKRTINCKKCGQAGHNSRSCGKRARQACGSSG